jgi:hypothetical protein
MKPGSAEIASNYSVALRDSGRFEEAVASADRAIAINPNSTPAHFNRAHALRDLCRFDEAIASLDRALAITPNYAKAHYSRGLLLLMKGDFEHGWPEYEWRWKKPDFTSVKREFPQPRWDGSPLADKTILLHPEQGLGDAIQFIRYAPLVEQRSAKKVIVESPPPLTRLLRESFSNSGTIEIVEAGQSLPPFDVQIPLLSLPMVFGTTLANIPADVPYLRAREFDRQLTGDFRVGLCWAGSRYHPNDWLRSIPLEMFRPLTEISGVTWFSLQHDEDALPLRLVDLTNELNDLSDTAAIIAKLDLVITVDTSIAHLAGALGKPTWTLVQFSPDWRWMLDRGDSPWYPTMRLFRQTKVGDWSSVIEKVARELGDRK